MTTREPATWIRQPSAVFTANDLDAAGGIVVRDDRIVELVGTGEEPATPAATVFDASRKVLLPGLINGHHHFYQTLTRAYPPALNKPLFAWLASLYPAWANLTDGILFNHTGILPGARPPSGRLETRAACGRDIRRPARCRARAERTIPAWPLPCASLSIRRLACRLMGEGCPHPSRRATYR